MSVLVALLALGVGFQETGWRQGIVVCTTGENAGRAGLKVLKDGGTAADAVAATALCQVVECGGCYVSAAGIYTMVYYDAATGKITYLDAGYNVPSGEMDANSIPAVDSGRTALVPGFMAGIEATWSKFGKRTRAQVFEPAIRLAEDGFKIDPILGSQIVARRGLLSRTPEGKSIFTRPDGSFYKTGDLFRQPALAETFRHVAAEGAKYMYTGAWAKHLVDAVQRKSGKLLLDDLARYKPIWQEPVRGKFRDYEIAASGYASQGGVSMVEGLNLVELANLRKSGHFTQSSESLFNLMQISHCMALGYLSDDTLKTFLGHDLRSASRVKKETSAWLWGQIKEGKLPWTLKEKAPGHSDGIIAVDKWGNVAVVTHSINTTSWGDTGIFVDGVSIPDSAAIQPYAVRMAGPGNHLPAATIPLIVLRNGKPWLASSAIGGGLHSQTLQVLTSMLDFGWDMEKAAKAPAFLLADFFDTTAVDCIPKGQFDQGLIDKVQAMGQKVRVSSEPEVYGKLGYWIGVRIDAKTGRLSGAGTPLLPIQWLGY